MQLVSDRILSSIVRSGGTHIFGYPGESTLPLYDSVFKNKQLEHVMARCERCAGFMADGFGRTSNGVAFCDAPGGVGTPWLVPALHEAYLSGIGLVAITTSSPDLAENRWPTTHVNHNELFSSVSKAVLSLRRKERVEELVQRAVSIAGSGRPGPVVLDVEPTMLTELSSESDDRSASVTVGLPHHRPRPGNIAIQTIAEKLIDAERPLLVIGGGVHQSDAYHALAKLVAATGVPVATTFNGKGALSEISPEWVGVVGAKGQREANLLATHADVLIWAGSKGGDKSTQYGVLPAKNTFCIQVDIDPENLGRTIPAHDLVLADLQVFLIDLCAELESRKWMSPVWYKAQENIPLHQPFGGASIASVIRKLTGPGVVIAADASRASSWMGAFDRLTDAGRFLIAPRGSGTLGYALPAAIGAAVQDSERRAVAICGDGGFSMSSHELDTAVALGLNLMVVVLSDSALGLLNQVGAKTLSSDFVLQYGPKADWVLLAAAYGAAGRRVNSMEGLKKCFSEWRAAGGVFVTEAIIDTSHVSPDLEMFMESGGRHW